MAAEWQFDEEAFLRKIPYPVTPTNVKGAYATVATPDGFDPNTASESDLIKNGILWRRPTAADPPALRELWQKVFSRKWVAEDRVMPVMEPQVGRVHNLRNPPRKATNTSYYTGGWSGAVSFGGPYNGICAAWIVPTVSEASEPPSESGSYDFSHDIKYDSSSWVGIDGWQPSPGTGSTDVLQTGVEQYVDNEGVAHYLAWYEWYVPFATSPSYVDQTPIPFTVTAGDEVVAIVNYVGKTAGSINIGNFTTGKSFSRTLVPPSGATFSGGSVEWIMEDPDGGQYGEYYTALAKFTPVVFKAAFACTSKGGINNPQYDDTCNIQTVSGQVLTNVTVGDLTVTIDFTG